MASQEVAVAVGPPRADRPRARRLIDRVGTTPGRLTVLAVVLLVLSLSCGLVDWLALRQRADLVHDMTVRSGPLTVSALDIYRSLSDADATAASDYLTAGTGSPALRARYLDDLAQAAEAMTVAARNADSSGLAATQLAVIGAYLPVYTGWWTPRGRSTGRASRWARPTCGKPPE